jgi:hypothetical protein
MRFLTRSPNCRVSSDDLQAPCRHVDAPSRWSGKRSRDGRRGHGHPNDQRGTPFPRKHHPRRSGVGGRGLRVVIAGTIDLVPDTGRSTGDGTDRSPRLQGRHVGLLAPRGQRKHTARSPNHARDRGQKVGLMRPRRSAAPSSELLLSTWKVTLLAGSGLILP